MYWLIEPRTLRPRTGGLSPRPLLLGVVSGIAKRFIEVRRRRREPPCDRRLQRGFLGQGNRSHLVVATRCQARFNVDQPLSSPKPEKYSIGLRPDEQSRPVVRVHNVAPLDRLFKSLLSANSSSERFDCASPPAVEAGHVLAGGVGRDFLQSDHLTSRRPLSRR